MWGLSIDMQKSIFKLTTLMVLISSFNFAFANYKARTQEVDQLINSKMKTIKSSEKLDIPEYKGDTLTFERLSKIRNIFNMDHFLPFEKRAPIVNYEASTPQKKIVKLKPITIPNDLKKIMNHKQTRLQQYPLNSFKYKGVVFQNNDRWGVVENSMEKNPLYLQEGMLIGKDYGHITDITKEGVIVSEWKKNMQKRAWEKVQAVIH